MNIPLDREVVALSRRLPREALPFGQPRQSYVGSPSAPARACGTMRPNDRSAGGMPRGGPESPHGDGGLSQGVDAGPKPRDAT